MQTVTFAREYRHKIDDLREAVYPPNVEIEVRNDVADAARKAGALMEEKSGERPAKGNGTRGADKPEG